MLVIRILIIIPLILFSISANAFDCKKASNSTEKAICASPDLVDLDNELNNIYKNVISSVHSETVKEDQRRWNKENLSLCASDSVCLKQRYQERIAELKKILDNDNAFIKSTVKIKMVKESKKKPYNWKIEYPKFSGSPDDVVVKLNEWVKNLLEDDNCSIEGAEDLQYYDFYGSLDVVKLNDNVAVIAHMRDTFCGGAHPDGGTYYEYFDIKSGKQIYFPREISSEVSSEAKSYLISKLSKYVEDAEAECKKLYSKDNLQYASVYFEYKNSQQMNLSIGVPHALGSCKEPIEISIKELKAIFSDKPEIIKLLGELEKD